MEMKFLPEQAKVETVRACTEGVGFLHFTMLVYDCITIAPRTFLLAMEDDIKGHKRTNFLCSERFQVLILYFSLLPI